MYPDFHQFSYQVAHLRTREMERDVDDNAPSGVEVVAPVGLEKISPSHIEFDDKYYNQIGQQIVIKSNAPVGQSVKSDRRIHGFRPGFWILSIIIILCLAGALGAGLGAGLAARYNSSTTYIKSLRLCSKLILIEPQG